MDYLYIEGKVDPLIKDKDNQLSVLFAKTNVNLRNAMYGQSINHLTEIVSKDARITPSFAEVGFPLGTFCKESDHKMMWDFYDKSDYSRALGCALVAHWAGFGNHIAYLNHSLGFQGLDEKTIISGFVPHRRHNKSIDDMYLMIVGKNADKNVLENSLDKFVQATGLQPMALDAKRENELKSVWPLVVSHVDEKKFYENACYMFNAVFRNGGFKDQFATMTIINMS